MTSQRRGRRRHFFSSAIFGDAKLFRCGAENFEGAEEIFVHCQHSGGVVEFAAVVRGGEDGDQAAAGKEFVSISHHLMSACDEINVHLFAEALDGVHSEDVGHTPGVWLPSSGPLVRIRPQEIDQHSFVCRVHGALDPSQLIPFLYLRREAAVHAVYLSLDQGAKWHHVEGILEDLSTAGWSIPQDFPQPDRLHSS